MASAATVDRVFVFGFHHDIGSECDFMYPTCERTMGSSGAAHALSAADEHAVALPPEWSLAHALALPDGVHNYDEQVFVFTLPQIGGTWKGALMYCTAVFKQVDAKSLVREARGVTRSLAQKSIVVASLRAPAPDMVQRTVQIAREYFAQRDFSKRDVLRRLVDAYDTIPSPFPSPDNDAWREPISFRAIMSTHIERSLACMKLLLLGKKVACFADEPCTASFTALYLAALFPADDARVLPACFPLLSLEHMDDVLGEIGNGAAVYGVTNSLSIRRPDTDTAVLLCSTRKLNTSSLGREIDVLLAPTASDSAFLNAVWTELRNKEVDDEDVERLVRHLFRTYVTKFLTGVSSAAEAVRKRSGAGEFGNEELVQVSHVLHTFNQHFVFAFLQSLHAPRVLDASRGQEVDVSGPLHPFAVKEDLMGDINSLLSRSRRMIDPSSDVGQFLGGVWSESRKKASSWFDGIRSLVKEAVVDKKPQSPSNAKE